MQPAQVIPGVDIVHIPSFAAQLTIPGSRFEHVFSPQELRHAHEHPRRAEHLAGKWAAKEAFIKAWSLSLLGAPPVLAAEEVNFADIEVLPDQWQRPHIYLRGTIGQLCPWDEANVSISHDGEYAIAMVTVMNS